MRLLLAVLIFSSIHAADSDAPSRATIESHESNSDTNLAQGLAAAGAKLVVAGKLDQAEQMLYRALAYDGGCGVAYFELAKLAEKSGSKDTALDLYVRASNCLPESASKVECLRRMQFLSPLSTRLRSAISDYFTSVEKIQNQGPITKLRIEDIVASFLKAGFSAPKSAKTEEQQPFDPSGAWHKDGNSESDMTVKSNHTLSMNGVPGKWEIKDGKFSVKWDKFWKPELMTVSDDRATMTSDNGHSMTRKLEK